VLGVGLTSALPAQATAQDPPPKGSVKPEADRLTRTPLQVAEQLAAVYGNRFEQVAYIPALPLVAKLRLSELTGDMKYAERVNTLVAPFLREETSPVPKSGSEQAGHLVFAELALRAQGKDRERWIRLCRAAADQIFDQDGGPLPVMLFHNEMSDAVFMAGPILAATGKLAGERLIFSVELLAADNLHGVCIAPAGSIDIGESDNHRVRRVRR
jgi:hypothetical protein